MADMAHLYFHSPCFDGIASAVLATEFFERARAMPAIKLHPVNYDVRATWLSQPLAGPFGVVDFLYHPSANFWADHHLTTFLDETQREDYLRSRRDSLVYDAAAGSCAGLLWRHLKATVGYRDDAYEPLVNWAERIDAARYHSVTEVIESTSPALRLNLGLTLGDTADYSITLVGLLRRHTLEEAAQLPEPRRRYEHVRVLVDDGLSRFKRVAHIEDDGIVVFDVDGTRTFVSRYAPFYFFPEARYSIGIVRMESGVKLTAMRNPWHEFPSPPLGKIAEKFGGGGHHRIGSINLRGDQVAPAQTVLAKFLEEIRLAEATLPTLLR